MRMTIEIKPDHHAKLLELAAQRGEKGFSSVIGEAIDAYLAHGVDAPRLRKKALRLSGSIGAREADRLIVRTRQSRRLWR